jgi:hypothetical protein
VLGVDEEKDGADPEVESYLSERRATEASYNARLNAIIAQVRALNQRIDTKAAAEQEAVVLSAGAVGQIRAALLEALQHQGGDLEEADEPSLNEETRNFEGTIRAALALLYGEQQAAAAGRAEQ